MSEHGGVRVKVADGQAQRAVLAARSAPDRRRARAFTFQGSLALRCRALVRLHGEHAGAGHGRGALEWRARQGLAGLHGGALHFPPPILDVLRFRQLKLEVEWRSNIKHGRLQSAQ